jgi:hypothetical protein
MVAREVEVQFEHPKIGVLNVRTKPNAVEWGYGLNTVNYPTYGGEVVQVLSCYIEDMNIEGDVRTYREIEEIYGWFIEYMQLATQKGRHDETPVKFRYFERNWVFDIIPKGLPGFRYGRDVVVPSWRMQAHVDEPDFALTELILDEKGFTGLAAVEGFDPFGTVTGEIGYSEKDPFSAPDVTAGNEFDPEKDRHDYTSIVDYWTSLIPSYLSGDFSALDANLSKPTFLKGDEGTRGGTNEDE